MDDDLDPRLEASLRLALHGEADTLPMLVREQDVEGARRARWHRRLALPAVLVGAAAVLALLVGTGTLTFGDRSGVGASPSPSPTPTLRPLATYDELLALMGPGAVPLLRGEHNVDADAIEVDLGAIPAGASIAYGVSCLGGSIDIVIVRAGAEVGTNQANCSIKPYVTWAPDLSAFGEPPLDGTEHVVVRSPGGVRWRVVVAQGGDAAPSIVVVRPSASPLPQPSLQPTITGETPIMALAVAGGGEPVETSDGVDGIEQYLVTGSCVGTGNIQFEIDGVAAEYPCGPFGPVVFLRDADNHLVVTARATGDARFLLRVSAWSPSVAWAPPALTLTGPTPDGQTLGRRAYAGCGLSWSPAGGGGFVEDCGPSWQPVAAPLTEPPGTSVRLVLADSWTITAISAQITPHQDIQPSGRAPVARPLTLTGTADGYAFDIQEAGDWGIRLLVSGERDGDRFQVPYYSRVIVQP